MPPRWRVSLARLTPYGVPPPLAALEAELGRPVIRLSANENPLGPSPRAVDAIRAEASRVHLYPDGGVPELRQAVARALGVEPAQIVCGNGGDEIITLVGRTLLEPGDEVVVPVPAFEPYAATAVLAGATVVPSPLRDYRIDLDDVLARVGARTKLVCLASPHNPTGVALPRAAWERFAARCPTDVLILLDEAYIDFVETPGEAADGLAALRGRPDSLLVLRTFSKIAGLAGLRVGYGVGGPEVIAALDRAREPFNVSRLAQVGAAAALADRAHRDATRRLVWAEKRALYGALSARGLAYVPTDANFLVLRLPPGSGEVAAVMRREGVLVRDGTAVGLPGHLRVSIGTPDQNAAMLAALDRALAALTPAPRRAAGG